MTSCLGRLESFDRKFQFQFKSNRGRNGKQYPMGLYWLFVIGSALVVSRGAGVLHKMWGSLLG